MRSIGIHTGLRLAGRAVVAAIAAGTIVAASSGAIVAVYSGGISGYSGRQGSNCNDCHGGGKTPVVKLDGPKYVLHDNTRSFSFLVSGGQKVAAGLDVAVSRGSLVATESGTHLDNGEVTHDQPKLVDGNGDVKWEFDFVAPAAAGAVTMFAAGNSVSLDGSEFGDRAATTTYSFTVVDNLTSFTEFGQGLAGSGGFVPHLSGVDGPSVGPWSITIAEGLGDSLGLLWAGVATKDQFPAFGGGHFYVDLSVQPWLYLTIRLDGTPGAAGEGGLALDAVDVSDLAPLSIYLQATMLDAGAPFGISLSNALQMDIQD